MHGRGWRLESFVGYGENSREPREWNWGGTQRENRGKQERLMQRCKGGWPQKAQKKWPSFCALCAFLRPTLSAATDVVQDLGQLVGFGVGEVAVEMLPDQAGVDLPALLSGFQALGREDCIDDTAIRRVEITADVALLYHLIHHASQPAPAEEGGFRQFAHT